MSAITFTGDDKAVRLKLDATEVDAQQGQEAEEQPRYERLPNQALQARPVPRRVRHQRRQGPLRFSLRPWRHEPEICLELLA